ncbi:ABC transporter permease [Pseudonocardia hispaniensis]|uniref:ABC transporter permease n=1 Tax=Pseudonocardia hispaniensis TaxID=904933 RepID=A0ABW1IYV5_9PSEU
MSLRVGIGIVALFGLVALCAPYLTRHGPKTDVGVAYLPPGPGHPLGTDDQGYDLWSQLLHGSRPAFAVGAGAMAVTMAIAVTVALCATLLAGRADRILMTAGDILISLPHLPLLLLVGILIGPSVPGTIALIAIVGWVVPAREIRARALAIRQSGYVRAARGFGAGTRYLMARHLIPALGPVLASVAVAQFGRAISLEAGLAFLGVGDVTRTSWGLTIRQALDDASLWFTGRWLWWPLPPGLAIAGLLLACALLGAGLETRLDPRLRERR